MKIYRSKVYNHYYNGSMEELMLKDENIKEDVVLIYQHSNGVVIGKNQNAYEEINRENIKKNKVQLSRRVSGGGAVYHDMGNINFAFLTRKDGSGYQDFLKPIVDFLKSLGLNAEFKGRNDLVINDMKVSGNAQWMYKDKIAHHGTLLFDVDLTKITNMLKPNKLKMKSKGIKSIRQRITNINDELIKIGVHISNDEFVTKLTEYIAGGKSKILDFPEKDYKEELEKLMSIRKSDEWIYNRNPKFSVENVKKFDGGVLKVKYNVHKERFTDIVFEGDFLSKRDIKDVENALIGINYMSKDFINKLKEFELEDYFGTIEMDKIIELVFEE